MTRPAIRIVNLSKEYRIGAREGAQESFREMLAGALTAPFRRLRRLGGANTDSESLWALRDVSFEVAPGEVVGIIGRNGAGKSTLLKILSRVTEPSAGRVEIAGRVSSLLEVGTGFHPELTGRENILLNGAILGMSRREILAKFDDIAAFAEIERFLDTPVKRYSSGMYVRLAFAVAAHLEPDVLIIDEVLTVGDTGFQEKCIRRMGDLKRRNFTILFVSHNLTQIEALCNRSILLASGRVATAGPTSAVIREYLQRIEHAVGSRQAVHRTTSGSPARISDVALFDEKGAREAFSSAQPIRIRVGYKLTDDYDDRAFLAIQVLSAAGQKLLTSACIDQADTRPLRRHCDASGAGVAEVILPPDLLNLGDYEMRCAVCGGGGAVFDYVRDIFFRIDHTSPWVSRIFEVPREGTLLQKLEWRLTR
ncbi:MAG: ABC transporter ATP-binding protein [Steroidobacteraceae bacterium]